MSNLALRPILIAAGGTGGHMFPAEALARELLARGSAVALVTDRRGAGFGPVRDSSCNGPARGLCGTLRNVI